LYLILITYNNTALIRIQCADSGCIYNNAVLKRNSL